jgi:hypothetical protein
MPRGTWSLAVTRVPVNFNYDDNIIIKKHI